MCLPCFNTPRGDIKYKDTVHFVPPISGGTVIKVYDGDTITIANRLPYTKSPLYRFSVRIKGIDCPEIRGSNESERICAQIAKDFVYNLVMDQNIILDNMKTDKYGRILADVLVEGENLGDLLIRSRLAVRYDGGTKESPRDWLEYHYNV